MLKPLSDGQGTQQTGRRGPRNLCGLAAIEQQLDDETYRAFP